MLTKNLWETLPEMMRFGPWPIAKPEVFFATAHSFAFTNLKPVLPGHVLVAPRRVVARVHDLTADEMADLFALARTVGEIVSAANPPTESLTLTIQDGKAAGQTVPHVHFHVIPRHSEDRFNKELTNDDIYKALDSAERVDSTRPPRNRSTMCDEALILRQVKV